MPVVLQSPLGDNPLQATLYYGQDCREALRQLPEQSVHTVVTSPPYWGLRDYQLPDSTWADGWVGQLGLEPTPEQYVAHLVEVFAEVWRVLRDDGTLWLNLGDSFASDIKGSGGAGKSTLGPNMDLQNIDFQKMRPRRFQHGMKPKDLVGIPWMVAFALRSAGWHLRSDIVWSKRNCMPESVQDRPTRSHEYVFLLAKQAHYFYDIDAVREPHDLSFVQGRKTFSTKRSEHSRSDRRADMALRYNGVPLGNPAGRNKRSVWVTTTHGYPGAHFATMPAALAEPMILAGTSAKGCCSQCGTSWQRVVETSGGRDWKQDRMVAKRRSTLTWQPTCQCQAPISPCTVLDPFSGSATTGDVAWKHGRNYIGIDLSDTYLKLAQARILGHAPPSISEATPDPLADLFDAE